MKPGDLIKHKRSNVLGVIIKIFESKKNTLATVLFSDSAKSSTAPLKILKDNWEIISDK
jgi:hypothetical protein